MADGMVRRNYSQEIDFSGSETWNYIHDPHQKI